jgi:hypothetical protein
VTAGSNRGGAAKTIGRDDSTVTSDTATEREQQRRLVKRIQL